MIEIKRVIFVEPQIENDNDILSIFNKYNSDSSFVSPHICLVFPFKSDIDSSSIDNILKEVLEKYGEIDIKLSGISISYEEKNNFVFLNVIDNEGLLNCISEELYQKLGLTHN